MHLYCIGQGSPTVVFESGTGEYWLSWYKTPPEVAKFTRVCSFDRAGLGWSDPSPHPRTSRVMAQEFHTLLHNAGVPAPFVLAGHSLGGANTRVYASLYPADVVGIVFVDAVHPDGSRLCRMLLQKTLPHLFSHFQSMFCLKYLLAAVSRSHF